MRTSKTFFAATYFSFMLSNSLNFALPSFHFLCIIGKSPQLKNEGFFQVKRNFLIEFNRFTERIYLKYMEFYHLFTYNGTIWKVRYTWVVIIQTESSTGTFFCTLKYLILMHSTYSSRGRKVFYNRKRMGQVTSFFKR